jgi:hypothetical protein
MFRDSDFDSAIKDSVLHPYTTKAPVLVRFAASPVYAMNDTAGIVPIAVLMLGDVANGKFNVIETSNVQYGNGENSSRQTCH